MRMCHVVILCVWCAIWLSACSQPPTSAPSPAPAEGPLYTTQFDAPAGETGQWSELHNRQADILIEEGRLHIVVKQADTLVWSVAGLALDDFIFEAEATPVDGPDDNGYGLIARRVDDENFYNFQISGDGYFIIQKRVKGDWVNLSGDWQPSTAIQPGRSANRLQVSCQGNTLTFSVNGVQLAQVKDGEFARGDIGLIAGALVEANVHVAFDDVSVKKAP